MSEAINFHYIVDGDDFTSAGEASVHVKKKLRQLGVDPAIIRRVSIAMYEAEVNMVIHANGGFVDVNVYSDRIEIILTDEGPGIEDVEKAKTPLFTTKPELERSGMGFAFMEAFMDEVQVASKPGKGTCVVMKKELDKQEV